MTHPVLVEIEAWDRNRPRSQQVEIGASGLFGCRAASVLRLNGVPETDGRLRWDALVGTAIHAIAEQAAPDTVLTEQRFIFRGVGATIDRYDPATRTLTDVKGLSLDTPLPTPTGWTTMGEVQPGDWLFGSDGQPCQVTAKSAVKEIGTYVVRFADGARVTCDREHIWWVLSKSRSTTEPFACDIEQMAGSVAYGRQRRYRVPIAGPLSLPEADLPIDPYVLGCWLGDGAAAAGVICKTPELFAEMAKLGYPSTPTAAPSEAHKVASQRTVYGLTAKLRTLNLLHNKHVPSAYLRGSFTQRLAVVQGLMDTDGTWNKARRRVAFSTTSKQLAADFYELLASLGQKPRTTWYTAHGFGLAVEACLIEWTPRGVLPFRIVSKASRVQISDMQRKKAEARTIRSIEPGPNVPTACVAVDSPNSTYLCGSAMVPTHNTKEDEAAVAKVAKYGPDDKHIAQVLLGAAALQDAGHPVEHVELLYLPRVGDPSSAYLWTGVPDRSAADLAADWAETVTAEAVVRADFDADGQVDGLRDELPSFCRAYCPYVTACRGEDLPVEVDALVEATVAEFLEADDAEKAAKQTKDAARRFLAPYNALPGLRWQGGNAKTSEEVDMERLLEDYRALIGEPPTRTVEKVTARSLRRT